MFILKHNSTINNLIGCYETFREQKIDEKCTLIPVLKPMNIERIGMKNIPRPSPGPKKTIYRISW